MSFNQENLKEETEEDMECQVIFSSISTSDMYATPLSSAECEIVQDIGIPLIGEPAVGRTERRGRQCLLSTEEKKRRSLRYTRFWRKNLENCRHMKVPPTNMPFTREEQRKMVKFLVSFENIVLARPKGLMIWYDMLETGELPHRTVQSLQNHFMKCLLPNIQFFFNGMSEAHKMQFRILQSCNSFKEYAIFISLGNLRNEWPKSRLNSSSRTVPTGPS